MLVCMRMCVYDIYIYIYINIDTQGCCVIRRYMNVLCMHVGTSSKRRNRRYADTILQYTCFEHLFRVSGSWSPKENTAQRSAVAISQ